MSIAFMVEQYNRGYHSVNNQSYLTVHNLGNSVRGMGTLADRIKERMNDLSLVQADVADRAGVSQVAIHKLLTGKSTASKKPDALATALECSLDWLLTGREPKRPVRVSEIAGSYAVDPELRRIPVINYVQAGHPREIIDDYAAGDGFDTVGIDPDTARQLGRHAFALVVDGESMLPDFRPGDLVVVDPDASVRPGDIVVAKLERDQAATLKKYRSRGADGDGHPVFELMPLNDDYPTLLVNSASPGQVIGPVIEHRRKMR